MGTPVAWTLSRRFETEWSAKAVRREPATAAEAGFEDRTDAELVAASLAGRTGAFDVIVSRHRRTVYHLCYRFAGNHEDASDLSQDVFLRAYRGLHSFRNESSLGTWLHRIGVNVCLNRAAVRKPRTEPIEAEEHVDTTNELASDRLLRLERASRVRQAIARLPRKQRATLILRMYQDMSHQAIAAALGSTVGTVKANLFHALQNLKKLIDGEGL
jgi:RNA polymerase sigma-70 factor (ECF subfamily)